MRRYLIKWLSLIDKVIRVMIQRLSAGESIYKGKLKKVKGKPAKIAEAKKKNHNNNPFQKRHYIKIKTRESVGEHE